MSLLGTKIRLRGVSQKGKNRIRENGEIWHVLAETQVVLFAKNEPGPWLWVVADGKDPMDKSARWVHGVGDKDFVRVDMDT